ncbi:restriction endonuclease subunit S [uncultured Corynebacterium sp.]|uniref:restriction endonuclease subunit S n=1 Tax=uncultured Corynebacterium sp. TaxID=159447 RepID=UPI002622087F|nr:restriction endonuclease subunit S [uncultured Corynebacterium sp.]
MRQLKDIGQIYDGPHATPKRINTGNLYFLNISGLSNGRLNLSTADRLSPADFRTWTRRVQPRQGDLLFSYETRIGEAALMPPKIDAALGRRMALLRPDMSLIDPRYLLYFWLSPRWQSFLQERTLYGATVNRIPIGEMPNWPIDIPAIAMQEKISEVLGSLDDKIAANNHILGIIDETIQSLWKHAIQLGATNTRLDDVIQINPRTPIPKGTVVRKIEMKNLPEAGFSISEWEEHEAKGGSRYRNGDTLLARITPCFENGKCGFVDFLEADAVGAGSTEFIVMRPQLDIPLAAPYAVANSADFRAFAAQTVTGTSGRQRVQARDLAAYETVWPNEEQLSNFGSRTTPLLDFAGELRDEVRVLTKTRDELLPLLMNGKITVREASQEAAAAGAQVSSEENEV